MENQNPLSPPPPQQEEPNPKKPKLSTTTTTNSDDEDHTITTTTTTTDKKPRYKRRKIAILFAYCGVGYQGMQKNPGAKTIEGDLEEALYFSGAVPETDRGCPKRFDFARSARTDKGVSAVGQVVSGKFYIDPPGFIERLNNNLPDPFRVFGFKRVTASFSAKKFCDRRRYVYLLPVFALDPLSHRDRESVIASLGSENELVKCLDCSERGRKVFEIQSGISSNTLSALSETDGKQENLTNLDDGLVYNCKSLENNEENVSIVKENVVCSERGISSNTLPALSESNNGLIVKCKTFENNEKNGSIVKESLFCYGDKEKERFNKILKQYEGTHNFHNFTTRTKAADPSANRYIISFRADTTVTVDGIEFVKCEVVGQSFMLHQIRKMIGVAVAIMRNCAPESLMETALQQDVRITVPTAPEVGLYLDECFFSSYNQKWKDTHEEVSMKDYAEEAEEFKLKHIYSHIASTEHKEGAVAVWLHSLNYRNYPDLCPEENHGANEVSKAQADESTGKTDTLLAIIASGRLHAYPTQLCMKTTVLEIDLERLATTMKKRLNQIFPFISQLCNRYRCGPGVDVTSAVISDVNMMVDTAMAVTYNRLRYVLQRYDPNVFVARMNPRSPFSNKFKFPAFISNVLGSIGPLRITDGPKEMRVVYATSADRSQTYGRGQWFDFKSGHFFRFIENLEAIGVPLAPIDVKAGDREGSFFSTIIPNYENGLFDFTAPFHHSHYKHKDIVSAWFTFNDDPALGVFGDCSLTVGCCTDADVIDAFDDLNIAPDPALASTRLVGGTFAVNVSGIRPAFAGDAAAVYVVGRGTERYYCTSLARRINEGEMFMMLREFIFKPIQGDTSF